MPQYPADINYIGDDRRSYFDAIDRALHDGWNFERARRAYRWLALEFVKATVFLGDGYPRIESAKLPFVKKVFNRLMRQFDVNYQKYEDIRRKVPLLRQADKINATIAQGATAPINIATVPVDNPRTLIAETLAIQNALRQIGRSLFPTDQSRKSSHLWFHLNGGADQS